MCAGGALSLLFDSLLYVMTFFALCIEMLFEIFGFVFLDFVWYLYVPSVCFFFYDVYPHFIKHHLVSSLLSIIIHHSSIPLHPHNIVCYYRLPFFRRSTLLQSSSFLISSYSIWFFVPTLICLLTHSSIHLHTHTPTHTHTHTL